MLRNDPYVQGRLAQYVSSLLENQLDTRIEVGNVRWNIPNRFIVDDLLVYDKQDTLMLQVPRLATKLEIIPFFHHQIRIDNAQLLGARIKLYKPTHEEPHNFQFLLDAFASNDTTKHPIDLCIGSLLLRRCQFLYDEYYEPLSPGKFNTHHLDISNLNLTAHIREFRQDSINAQIRRLGFSEQSGLELQEMKFSFISGINNLKIKDFFLKLPHSSVSIPKLSASFEGMPDKERLKDWLQEIQGNGQVDISLTPFDLRAFLPSMVHFQDSISLHTHCEAENGILHLPDLSLQAKGNPLSMNAEVSVSQWFSKPHIEADIKQLRAESSLQQYFSHNLHGEDATLSPFLLRLKSVQAEGKVLWDKTLTKAQLDIETPLGQANIEGTLQENKHIEAQLRAHEFQLGHLLSDNEKPELDKISLDAKTEGILKSEDGKPALSFNGIIHEIDFKGHTYNEVGFQGNTAGGTHSLQANLNDEKGNLDLDATISLSENSRHIQCKADIEHLRPFDLNLTKRYEGDSFSGSLETDISETVKGRFGGRVELKDLLLSNDSLPTLPSTHLVAISLPKGEEQHVEVESPILSLQADGAFQWENIGQVFLQIGHSYLPSIFPQPTGNKRFEDHIDFTAFVADTLYLQRLLGKKLYIPQESTLRGSIDGHTGLLNLTAESPHIDYGGEKLRNIRWHAESSLQFLQTSMVFDRIMKGKNVEVGLDAYTGNDRLMASMHWNNHRSPSQFGEINLTGEFYKDLEGRQAIHGRISPSDIVVSDTIWKLHPATIRWHDRELELDTVRITQGNRYMKIFGHISQPEDTLRVDIKDLNLEYIFNIINFHTVDFAGEATGHVYLRQLTEKPIIDAHIEVPHFLFNNGDMGNLAVHGNFGEREKSIYLDADIREKSTGQHTQVEGTITPGKAPGSGIELMIKADKTNLFFLNKFTKSIFTNFQGKGTGWCRVFGPFKQINVEGDMLVNEANMHVNALGVDYHLAGDSVILRPDNIWIRHATAYDKLGGPDIADHRATVDGHLMHHFMKRMSYDFSIHANNILGYDFKDFGDQTFYGTIFASGDIHLSGQPGTVNIDLQGSPTAGSQIVYNSTSPETITEAGFISFVDHSTQSEEEEKNENQKDKEKEDESRSDIRLNFNMNVTPDMTLRVLMDTKTGDCISLNGTGHILANYYNKGKFQMYGTYHVERGLYKMSIQDVIHKDFQFQPGGTIVFGGNAFQAALNLKAKYTVPNVSLDDLSATGLGLSNTRVDCIMNLGGKAGAPSVTFDFDLPQANEDEKQMVRSMLSTEEEKNMQVIYLLGIGRFYSYGTQYTTGNNQSTTAMNSLLSSTLSSQFNQMMSNVVGSNWSFGANLRTGETGWNELDVEGLLSGRLLNNRLLLNGNFGYRESYYSTNNFIGDFDVQYLLTPSGGIALKAYNQTNDKYFIQSSLTTQGIGIQFKKDFNRWMDMFKRSKKAKR